MEMTLPTESEITTAMTRLKKYRDVQPNAIIKVAFFAEAPNYHTGSLSDYWSTYYPNIDDKGSVPNGTTLTFRHEIFAVV